MSVGGELPGTVGALHERIYELYEARGWFVFQQLYHEAAGLHPRPKTAGSLDAVTGSDAAPLNCDPIEPGLVHAIMQSSSRVQRWLLAPPRDPPPWRYRETGAERQLRGAIRKRRGVVRALERSGGRCRRSANRSLAKF